LLRLIIVASNLIFQPYSSLTWPTEISNQMSKEKVANKLADLVEDGQTIGVGSGTTSFLALRALALRKESSGLDITVVPTSLEILWYCEAAGFEIGSGELIDLAFDGADEVDPVGNLIKGRGGALLRERLNFDVASRIILLVDSSKFVDELGSKFRAPVEVSQKFAYQFAEKISLSGLRAEIRLAGSGKDGPVITESGNLLFDLSLDSACDVHQIDEQIRDLPGVVDTGLFLDYKIEILGN
jgi:ribose 5-phosphate isomerase A